MIALTGSLKVLIRHSRCFWNSDSVAMIGNISFFQPGGGSVMDADFVNDVVKGAPEIVDTVSEHESPSSEVVRLVELDGQPMLGEVGIVVSD